MNAFIEQLDTLYTAEFQTLLWVSAIASVTVIVAMLIQRIVGSKVSVTWIGMLWLVVLVRFVLFVAPESPTSLLNLMPQTPKPVFEPAEVVISDSSMPLSEIDWSNDTQFIESESEFAEQASQPMEITFTGVLKIVWLAGILWLTVLLIVRYYHLRSIIKRTNEPSPELQNLFNNCRQKFGFTRRTRLRISFEMKTPGMTGIFCPVILLPSWAEAELSQKQLELVFVHEQIHIRNCDGIVQLISYAISMLHWFNPFVHIALRRIDSCRELGCDRQVLKTLGQNPETQLLYGQTILQIAERSCGQRNISPVLIGGFIGNDNKLIKQRIAMLINSKPPRRFGTAIFTSCFLALIAIGFTHAQTQDPVEPKQPQVSKAETAEQNVESAEQEVVPAEPADDEVKHPAVVDFDSETPIGVQVETNVRVNFAFKISNIIVENPKALVCTPVTPSTLIFTGMKPGVHTVLISSLNILPNGRPGKTANRQQLVVYVTHKDDGDKELTKKLNTQLQKRANKVLKDFAGPIKPENGKSYSIEAGSSRLIKCDFNIPELMVVAPKIVRATPVSPDELLITALKVGESKVVIFNAKREKIEVKILAKPQPELKKKSLKKKLLQEIKQAIGDNFPFQNITIHMEDKQLVLSGGIDFPQCRENVLHVVKNSFKGKIVDRLKIEEKESIAFDVKVYEVSTAKLRALDTDFRKLGASTRKLSKFADLISNADIKTSDVSFKNFAKEAVLCKTIDALEKNKVAVLKAKPTLIAKIGRPAKFFSGIEIPVGSGDNREMRPIGTTLDLTARYKDAKEMRNLVVEIRAEISQTAEDLSGIDGVPGFRVRRVSTGLRANPDDTLALVLDWKTKDGKDTEMVFLVTPTSTATLLAERSAEKTKKATSDY